MNTILDIIGNVSNFFGFVSGVFAILIYMKLKAFDRLDEPVNVLLSLADGEQKIELPLQMRRRDLTRAEFLGRMGMIPMREKGKRFALRHLFTPAFITGINEVADGKTSTLEIPCSQEEIDQFDL